ncbi:MAG: hypothetical protein C4527_13800 [Candidatus Omnitrophota bacterium]|jgi:hypothetical protein|nr:MAG: hypothetical protein C4527_13800 [Candidatus Omnitrophota bacterium]
MYKSFFKVLVAIAPLIVASAVFAQAPTFTISDPIVLFGETETKEAGLAVNTREAEVLFVTIDTIAVEDDPITGQPAVQCVMGFYYNPVTLQQIGDPFVIVGNPRGNLQKLTVTYNPVSNQYFVAVAADSYSPNSSRVPLMAIVNSSSVAASAGPIAKVWTWDEGTATSYQDTAVAASAKNGNMIYVSEYTPAGESEGVIGLLYDKDGNLLTPQMMRLDTLEPTRDEDDPDVMYLEENDVFLFITNIDPSTSANRITATIIQTTPDANGNMQAGNQQVVSQLRKSFNAGHPSAIENPFNKEFIGVLDYDNGSEGGDIFYFNIGPAPNYIFTEARDQVPYFEAAGGVPFSHRHPRLAVDPNRGVIVISHNATGGFQGMVFTLLGPDGSVLPGRPDTLYVLEATDTAVSNDANFHDVKYDPHSGSFLVIYATGGGLTKVTRLTVTSTHLVSVDSWMLMD